MEEILTIQERMLRVMRDVGAVRKDQTNTQQHYPFRGVDAVVNAVSPLLVKHSVVVLPFVKEREYEPVETSQGKLLMSVRLLVEYRFIGPGGDSLIAQVAGEAFDSGDKATAKAMSVAFRTALLQALCLPTDERDPDADSYERSARFAASAAPGESTVNANVVESGDAKNGQAAQDVASPPSSATPGGGVDGVEVPAADRESGQGAAVGTPAGASTNYLSKDDQNLLGMEYGTKAAALKHYRQTFDVGSIAKITYEMRDLVEGANA